MRGAPVSSLAASEIGMPEPPTTDNGPLATDNLKDF